MNPKATAALVRPKASQRKGRCEHIVHKARLPTQERSQRRFDKILAVMEDLLQTARMEDISFYDIAHKARMSPTSVHYMFPTMAAVRIELTKLYNQRISGLILDMQGELAAMHDPTWQEWVRQMADTARRAFNSQRHVCEVLLGPVLNREARLANVEANNLVGRSVLESLRSVFLVPEIPGLETKFSFMCEIADALWSRSYLQHGYINDEIFEECVRVQIAYLRSVLPETLSVRVNSIGP